MCARTGQTRALWLFMRTVLSLGWFFPGVLPSNHGFPSILCHTIRYEEPPPKMDRFHWSLIAKETRVDWTNCWYSITVYIVGQQKKKKTAD
jgi:hypothetical protein